MVDVEMRSEAGDEAQDRWFEVSHIKYKSACWGDLLKPFTAFRLSIIAWSQRLDRRIQSSTGLRAACVLSRSLSAWCNASYAANTCAIPGGIMRTSVGSRALYLEDTHVPEMLALQLMLVTLYVPGAGSMAGKECTRLVK
jgi:hypothetical protein